MVVVNWGDESEALKGGGVWLLLLVVMVAEVWSSCPRAVALVVVVVDSVGIWTTEDISFVFRVCYGFCFVLFCFQIWRQRLFWFFIFCFCLFELLGGNSGQVR